MRVRVISLCFCLLALATIGGVIGSGGRASALLQQATPGAAATPEGQAPAGATPTAAAATNVVTLVGWYTQDPSGDFLNIGPLRTNDNLVAGPGEVTDRTLTGKVDFTSGGNDGLPRIAMRDSAFNAYPVVEGDLDTVQRWTYFNDDPSLRPATMVMQIVAVKGPYKGYEGTVTFVSRANDAGGVIIIVLNPPS